MRRLAFTHAAAPALLIPILLLAATSFAAEPNHTSQWFKGNLHTHSLWSDGNDFPEMICDWYVRNGYHFLALSDHNILSQGEKWINAQLPEQRGAIQALERYQARFGQEWVETRAADDKLEVRLKPLDEFRTLFERPGEFLLIQAEEITDHYEALPVHINASNIQELIRPRGGDSVRETIANNLRAVTEQSQRTGKPILAHLNHPNFRYAVTAEDLAAVVEERFFEVYNGHPGVNQQGDEEHPSVEAIWDIANTIRIAQLEASPLYGLATDDSHHYFSERGATPGRGWVMVRAAQLDAEHLIEAIEKGDFYASTGVTLADIGFNEEERTLSVEIAAEPDAAYTTQFIGTRIRQGDASQPIQLEEAAIGEVLATAEGMQPRYQLQGDELYVRAVVTSNQPAKNPSFDGQMQQAWTQPVGWKQDIMAKTPLK